MASNGYTPMQQLMSNPAYFGLTQSNWQTRQNASAQLAAFDQKYGDLFQMGYSMSPMAAAMNQSAMRGIMAEQQTGQMVNMGGGGMAMLNSAIGYMNGDSSQLGNILNTPWNFSGGGMGAYPRNSNSAAVAMGIRPAVILPARRRNACQRRRGRYADVSDAAGNGATDGRQEKQLISEIYVSNDAPL